jgi:1,2-diacylglycerol 3-alpha-glucosyltransferase
MNIGIFTETYYPQINGVVTSIRALEKQLNNQGHKVYIFTTTHPDAKPRPRVFRLPSMPFWSMPSHRVAFTFSPKALKIIKDLELDIIHTQTEFPMGLLGKTAATFFNIPIVHTYHTMYEDYVHYILRGYVVTPKMAKDFSKLFCNSAEAVIAPSQKVYNVLRDYGVKRDIEIIPTGIDLEPFKRSNFNLEELNALRAHYNLKPETPVILSLGRLAKEKSIDVIIKAIPNLLTKIPDAKLLIVGDGPGRATLEALVCELNIKEHVIFAGQQAWVDVPKFYNMANIFVTASVTETQGLTYAEAMAAQIPVVAKKDDNIVGLLKDNVNGRIFSDDSELPTILHNTLTNKQDSQRFIVQAYMDVQAFSAEQFGKSVIDLYSNVIQAHQLKKSYSLLPKLKTLKTPTIKLPNIKSLPLQASNNIKKIKSISIKHTFHSKKIDE